MAAKISLKIQWNKHSNRFKAILPVVRMGLFMRFRKDLIN